MATVLGPYFKATKRPALEGVGWEVKVRDYSNFNKLVAEIPEFKDLAVKDSLNDSGSGSITLDARSPFWDSTIATGEKALKLLDREYLWEAYESGVLRVQWLGRNVQENLLEEDENRAITVSGPGAADALRDACVMPPGFPAPVRNPSDPTNSDLTRFWTDPTLMGTNWFFHPKWPAMKIWLYLLHDSQSRAVCKFIDPQFDYFKDSASKAWSDIKNPSPSPAGYRPELGKDLLEMLNELTGQDLNKMAWMRAEWHMNPNFKLDVRGTTGVGFIGGGGIGTDRSKYVRFYEGNTSLKERTRVRDKISNYCVVQTTTQMGNISSTGQPLGGPGVSVVDNTSLATSAASIQKWRKREMLNNKNTEVIDPKKRASLAQVMLAQIQDERTEWTIQVPYDSPGRKPFVDYNVGDWIGIVSVDDESGVSVCDSFRVLDMTVHVDENGMCTVELTLESRLQSRQREYSAQIQYLINMVGAKAPDSKMPSTGTNITNSGTYVDTGGRTGSSPYTAYSPYTGLPSTIGGRSGGTRVWIQDTDPGSAALEGDFWYNTTYSVPPAVDPWAAYADQQSKPPVSETIDSDTDSAPSLFFIGKDTTGPELDGWYSHSDQKEPPVSPIVSTPSDQKVDLNPHLHGPGWAPTFFHIAGPEW